MRIHISFRGLCAALTFLLVLYIILPFCIIYLVSFSKELSLIPTEITLKWYFLWAPQVIDSLKNTLIVSGSAAAFAVLIGMPTGYVLAKKKIRIVNVIRRLIVIPQIIPGIILGVVYLQFFSMVPVFSSDPFLPLIVAHTFICLPFTTTTIRASLEKVERNIEEAAYILGASPLRTFFDVILPVIFPGILAGAILAFGKSVNDFVIAFFLTRPGYLVLSMRVYESTYAVAPQLTCAVSVVLNSFAIAMVLIFEKIMGRIERT